MPSYCYYEDTDDDIDVGPDEIAAERDKDRQFVSIAKERMEPSEFMSWIAEAQSRADAFAMPEAAE